MVAANTSWVATVASPELLGRHRQSLSHATRGRLQRKTPLKLPTQTVQGLLRFVEVERRSITPNTMNRRFDSGPMQARCFEYQLTSLAKKRDGWQRSSRTCG